MKLRFEGASLSYSYLSSRCPRKIRNGQLYLVVQWHPLQVFRRWKRSTNIPEIPSGNSSSFTMKTQRRIRKKNKASVFFLFNDIFFFFSFLLIVVDNFHATAKRTSENYFISVINVEKTPFNKKIINIYIYIEWDTWKFFFLLKASREFAEN